MNELTWVDKYVSPYRKSVLAFVVPFAGNLLAAGQDDSHGGSSITGHEWLESFLLSIVSAAAVWGVANTTVGQTMAKRRAAAAEEAPVGDDS